MNDVSSRVEQIAARATALYSRPTVALEIVQLTSEPQVDAHRLKECLEQDPALVCKILRVVNSSFFGLRREVVDLNQALALLGIKPLKLLVLGGSLGAQALNATVPQALSLLPEEARPEVTHQAGAQHLEALCQGYAAAGVRAEALAFIDDMAKRYGEADVVICRAGALTVAELACAGVASILVPFPHAVDDHQTGNAQFLCARGAAILASLRGLGPMRPAWVAGWRAPRSLQGR